ncbi:hypothetical protein AB0L40_24495 [Patulibacter sp. NPDC049589]|uniref:hypothetical protein n=1 Tax=Patulibacter sp. NPDC049589 TaxID=3154731 RepID=UPI003417237F
MPWWLHTAAGLAIVIALGAASWRLAGRLVAPPITRGLAAVALTWLGAQLGGLAAAVPGGPGVAVTGAVVVAVAAGLVLWRVPRTASPPLAPDERRLVAVVGLLVLLLSILSIARPAIGFDGLLYHLAIPAAWLGDGRVASLPSIVTGLPVEAYPVGVEVSITWAMTVTGATVVSVLVTPAALGVAVVGVWTLTRRLGGSEIAAWGAVASSVAALPFLAQAGGVATDLPGAALLACGAALLVDAAVRGRDVPEDAVPGLLLGLCAVLMGLGVKTTAACGGLLFLLLAWRVRGALLTTLRRQPLWLLLVAAAGLCGLAWLTRNLVLHGNPGWPLLASSSGDPLPPALVPFKTRFVDQPLHTLRAGGDVYLQLAWTVPILGLAALAVVVRGRGALRATAICGLLGAVAWGFAPATAIDTDPYLAAGATRYLMPCWILLAAAAWAGASTAIGGRRRWPAVLGLAVLATVVAQLVIASTYTGAREAVDEVPLGHAAIALGVAAGLLAVLLIDGRRAVPFLTRLPAPPRVASAVVVVALAGAVLWSTPGFWGRHATAVDTASTPSPDQVVLATGGVPAFSLGAYGRPGGRLVPTCADLQAGLAAGRTVAVGPSTGECPMPGTGEYVDGFLVHTPGAGTR